MGAGKAGGAGLGSPVVGIPGGGAQAGQGGAGYPCAEPPVGAGAHKGVKSADFGAGVWPGAPGGGPPAGAVPLAGAVEPAEQGLWGGRTHSGAGGAGGPHPGGGGPGPCPAAGAAGGRGY